MGNISIGWIVALAVLMVVIIFVTIFFSVRSYLNSNENSHNTYYNKPTLKSYPVFNAPEEVKNEIDNWKLNGYNFRIQVIEKYRSDNNYSINPKFTEMSHILLSNKQEYSEDNAYAVMLNKILDILHLIFKVEFRNDGTFELCNECRQIEIADFFDIIIECFCNDIEYVDITADKRQQSRSLNLDDDMIAIF